MDDEDDDEQRRRGTPAWYEPWLARLVAGLARVAGAVRTSLLRLPRRLRLVLGAAVAVVALLGVTLVPFLARSPVVKAEVTGRIPATLSAADVMTFEVAVDNTGDTAIRALCVVAGFDRPATLVRAVFDGVDPHPASGNRVCGGLLNGGQVVGVQLTLQATAGPLHITLRPQDGATVIGPALSGTVTIG